MLPARRLALVLACFSVLVMPAVMATPLGLETYAVSANNGYLNKDVVADVAGTLWLVNLDLPTHDIIARDPGPDDNPWCQRFPAGACPLFASALIGLGQQGIVHGTDQLTPLESYEFYCSIHPWMTGTLTAL